MSIRLDPRRLGILKQLAAEQGARPGDLVRGWVEERIDGERLGSPVAPTVGVSAQLEAIVARLTALEAAAGIEAPSAPERSAPPVGSVPQPDDMPGRAEADTRDAETPDAEIAATVSASEPADEVPADHAPTDDVPAAKPPTRTRAKRVAAAPAGERVALHDEMIAVISERGPMTAGELASAIGARGRYAPPRSGKPLDGAMVSQRVSNPTYRARFTRDGGRIGLAAPTSASEE